MRILEGFTKAISISTGYCQSGDPRFSVFEVRSRTPMNDHHNHNHVNGHQVNGEHVDEAELDAYEERLTNEAVLDQVKVKCPP